ncbi:cytochrome b-c1 complex subunit Rieske, mitochondrial-like isoform X2 [Amphiura filiformis]|uniref:cytochrome b-c1 complex subunit Rieske, mitochondrial-like isoform X2 n=1 Tax=Amphiura filiformis TaxID=82378 RepID=UPI003B225077
MLSSVSKIGAFAPFASATCQNVATQLRPAVYVAQSVINEKLPERSEKLTSQSMSTAMLPKGLTKVTSGIHSTSQVRFAHTDYQVPDFSHYRKDSTANPYQTAEPSAPGRKSFSYLFAGGGAVIAAYGAKVMVQEFIVSMNASADVLALAKIEVNLGDIPEGKNLVMKWRGKPLFVRHRTQEEIDTELAVDVASLRDPQHDTDRATKPDWLVLIGVCTHLGCVPIANAGDYGGYYCPCHGSHYDASGRIRKGPAPLNLEVPEHSFVSEELLIVG